MRIRNLTIVTVAAALMISVASCGSSHKSTARASGYSKHSHSAGHGGKQKPVPQTIRIDKSLPTAAQTLLAEANTWLGVPYQWGGNDRQGVDCSGFVTQVFLKALDIKLPRTSVTQSEYCTNLDRKKLQPGDLVFFDTSGDRQGTVSHVGLYIGDGNMIHASTSRGVIVSDIDGVYYGERLLGGGRVEAFYAMERNAPRTDKLPDVMIAEQDAVEVAAAVPVVAAAAPLSVRNTPAKAEEPRLSAVPASAPVYSLPEAAEPKPAPTEPKPAPVVTASAPVRSAATPVNPDIASRDARAMVLDFLVEEKLDSIYTK